MATIGALLLLSTMFCNAARSEEPVYDIDIPSMTAAEALNRFAEQTGAIMLFSYDLASARRANAVRGRYTLLEGLELLLRDTGLSGGLSNKRVVNISQTGDRQRLGEEAAVQKAKSSWVNRVAAFVGSMFAVSAASGQDASSSGQSIEEIIVTAQKREERLQDVPISIAVISGQDIERRGLIGMEDYLRSIPSVNEIDLGSNKNAIVIRGISTSPDREDVFSGTSVAVYFDETPITGALGTSFAGPDLRPADIERIEVLRGPQGTTFGSSSLGGAIRMIPVKPQLDRFGAKLTGNYSETSGFGSDNSMIQGVVNIPIVTDKFAVRAVGYRYEESGFYRNIAGSDAALVTQATNLGLGDLVQGYFQDDVGRTVTAGGRLAALWQPTDKLDLSMNLLTQTLEQDGQPLATTAGTFEQARMPVAPHKRVRDQVGEAIDTKLDYLANLVLNYDLGWAKLTSAVSQIEGGAQGSTFVVLPSVPSTTLDPSVFDSFTVETRLTSQLPGRFQFLGGLFYEDVKTHVFQTADWSGAPGTSPFSTDPIFIFDAHRQIEQRAVFGEGSYELTDELTATVGARYYDYDKSERLFREGALFGFPTGQGVTQLFESDEGDSVFRANLSYKPSQEALVYASWSEGFRLGRPAAGVPAATCDQDGDGVVDGTSVTIEDTQSIDSDFLTNYELGGKFSLFDRRLTVDTAIYHIKWEGLPISQRPPCNQAFTINAGEATSDGVELQASLSVTRNLRLDFGGSYTDAQLADDKTALALGAAEGARLPGSPRVNANLAAQYDFEIAGHKTFVRADSFYVGEFFGTLQETPDYRVGDYVKLDARAGVALGNLNVEIFVRNLTNEDALTWRSVLYQGTRYRMRPRTVGLQLGYSFE